MDQHQQPHALKSDRFDAISKTTSLICKGRMEAGRSIARKYRRNHMKMLQNKEYEKLRNMVPWLRQKSDSNHHNNPTSQPQHQYFHRQQCNVLQLQKQRLNNSKCNRQLSNNNRGNQFDARYRPPNSTFSGFNRRVQNSSDLKAQRGHVKSKKKNKVTKVHFINYLSLIYIFILFKYLNHEK